MSKSVTREQWLSIALHKHVASRLRIKAGVDVPADCKVSIGFPGGGSARKRIGECWPRARSSKGVNEIFINPSIADSPAKMLDVLVHEAIHAADDCASGHKGFFARVARAVGLEGKLTATHAGPQLADWIASTIDALPTIEHSKLNLDGRKKQSTRMLKVVCGECGYTLRTTQKWVEVGLPTCCCGGTMEVL
jgi:hypothetical protein